MMPNFKRGALSLLLAGALTGCETVKQAPGVNLIFGDDQPSLVPDPTSSAGISYDNFIIGLGEGETEEDTAENIRMRNIVESAARVYRLQDKPPPNLALLRRRAASDVDLVERALKSEGYFEGEATIRVIETEDTDPVVRIDVRKGPRYALARQTLALAGPIDPEIRAQAVEAVSANVSGPAQGRAVVDAEADALALLRRSGWPYATRADRQAIANFDLDTVDVTSRMIPGPLTVYGPVTFEGLTTVEQDYPSCSAILRQPGFLMRLRLTFQTLRPRGWSLEQLLLLRSRSCLKRPSTEPFAQVQVFRRAKGLVSRQVGSIEISMAAMSKFASG